MGSAHRVLSETLREVKLCYVATLGTSGAAPTTPTRNDGFGVLSSAGSGVYTLPLTRTSREYTVASIVINQADTYSATAARFGRISVDNVTGVSPSITFVITNSAGTPVQPATSDVIRVNLTVVR